MANCTECKENRCETSKKKLATISKASAEFEISVMERANRRLFILLLITIVLLVGSNIAWLVYEKQFESVKEYKTQQEVVQDTENGSNSFIGGDYYGTSEGKHDNNDNDIPRP